MSRLTLSLFLPFIFCYSFSIAQTEVGKKTDSSAVAHLFQAIRSNDLSAVENLLNAGADVNAIQDNYSALMSATLCGSVSAMEMLIDHGARINYANTDSITALWLAVPDYTRTKILLDHGADPKLRSKEGYTPLIKLVTFPGSARVLDLMMARGAELKKCTAFNELLYYAAGTGDTVLTGRLMAAGFNANDSTAFGDRPIIQAASYRCSDVVRQLVAHGTDVNCTLKPWSHSRFAGITPLMMAAIDSDTASMKFLLASGANVNARSVKGWTPLMMLEMAETDLGEMTALFLKAGADPSVSQPDGSNAFYYAHQKGKTRSTALLAEKSASVNLKPKP